MPVHRKTLTDGITDITVETVELTAPTVEQKAGGSIANDPGLLGVVGAAERDAVHEMLQRAAQLSTFDGRVTEFETNCRNVLGSATPEELEQYGSRAWYANEVVTLIEQVRRWEKLGRVQLALSTAVRVGATMQEAVVKHEWDLVQRSLQMRRRNTAAAKRRGDDIRADVKSRDERIRVAAIQYRAKHPHSRVSTRAMAASLSRALNVKESTIRGRLRKLRIQ